MTEPGFDIFTLMIEPARMCNIRCLYCYAGPTDPGIMSKQLLSKAIQKAVNFVELKDLRELHIIWHGGEPLMAGLDFFLFAQDEIGRLCPGINVTQFLQTNGLLLNTAWARFFSQHDINLGISLDGPRSIHDTFRRKLNHTGTFEDLMKKINLLEKWGILFGFCCVVTARSLGRERQIYEFFRRLGYPFRANPVLPPHHQEDWSHFALNRGQYGDFLCRLLDAWKESHDRVPVSPLDNYISAVIEGWSSECQHQRSCIGKSISVRPDGSVTLCSRFQRTEIHDIREMRLDQFMALPEIKDLELRFNRLTSCHHCRFREICHGGCIHNAVAFETNPMKKDPMCADYQIIFDYITKLLDNFSQDAI